MLLMHYLGSQVSFVQYHSEILCFDTILVLLLLKHLINCVVIYVLCPCLRISFMFLHLYHLSTVPGTLKTYCIYVVNKLMNKMNMISYTNIILMHYHFKNQVTQVANYHLKWFFFHILQQKLQVKNKINSIKLR